jgi:hypothetical protein
VENTKTEERVLESESVKVADELQALNDYQLALIGGGIGDVHFG